MKFLMHCPGWGVGLPAGGAAQIPHEDSEGAPFLYVLDQLLHRPSSSIVMPAGGAVQIWRSY